MVVLEARVETCCHQDCIVDGYMITTQKKHILAGNYEEL